MIILFRPMRRSLKEMPQDKAIRLLLGEKRGVLAVNGDDGYPYAVPMSYYYDPEVNKIYFHGAKAGHKAESLKKDSKCCFTVYGGEFYKQGEWAPYLRSVVVFGRCHPVEDKDLSEKELRMLAKRYYPNNAAINEVMDRAFSRVQIYEIEIEHMTCKQIQEK